MEYDLVLALPVKVVVNLAVADAFDLLWLPACRDHWPGSRHFSLLLLIASLLTIDIMKHRGQRCWLWVNCPACVWTCDIWGTTTFLKNDNSIWLLVKNPLNLNLLLLFIFLFNKLVYLCFMLQINAHYYRQEHTKKEYWLHAPIIFLLAFTVNHRPLGQQVNFNRHAYYANWSGPCQKDSKIGRRRHAEYHKVEKEVVVILVTLYSTCV